MPDRSAEHISEKKFPEVHAPYNYSFSEEETTPKQNTSDEKRGRRDSVEMNKVITAKLYDSVSGLTKVDAKGPPQMTSEPKL